MDLEDGMCADEDEDERGREVYTNGVVEDDDDDTWITEDEDEEEEDAFLPASSARSWPIPSTLFERSTCEQHREDSYE